MLKFFCHIKCVSAINVDLLISHTLLVDDVDGTLLLSYTEDVEVVKDTLQAIKTTLTELTS